MIEYPYAAADGLLSCALDAPELALESPAELFSGALHRELWTALQHLANQGRKPDAATLTPLVRDPAETMALVVRLTGQGVPSNADAYRRQLDEFAQRRKLRDLADGLAARADMPDIAVTDAATWATEALAGVGGDAETGAGVEAVRRRFPALDVASLLDPNRPEREWVMAGLLPAGASVALIAPAGVGKSLLILAASMAVARGDRAFMDLSIGRPRRVLYIDMENTADDLAERFRALGIRQAPERLTFLHLPALDPLDTPRGGRDLERIVDAYELARGDVVVLDSFQRVTAGAENDSDTIRAFYASSGLMLKRRGLTVVRTDNTGRDTERGARGSSGKRDDVDVEWIMTRDGDTGDRFKLTPGKARLSDVRVLAFRRITDDEGRLTFDTVHDPFRSLVLDAMRALDELGVDQEAGQRPALDALKKDGRNFSRDVIRQAVKERKGCADTAPRTPEPDSVPDCADASPRTLAQAA